MVTGRICMRACHDTTPARRRGRIETRMADFNPLRYPIALREIRYFSGQSAWAGHIPFGLAVIAMTRPRTLVELGTHWGDSYCAFCQAVAELKLETRCHAVDTWRGDAHTGAYPDVIYNELKAFHDPAYGAFSTLLRATFDEAAPQFADGGVDLLHIDGLHTYDAVKHDFETWKPKLSPRGVVLFHDTAMKHGDFGVWKLWDELKGLYPSFDFVHEAGLGILAVGADPPGELLEFIAAARCNEQAVRDYFTAIGARWIMLRLFLGVVRPLQRAHGAVDQWRARTGRRVQPLPAGPQGATALGHAMLGDVQELLLAQPGR
jgi:hypothetical protein